MNRLTFALPVATLLFAVGCGSPADGADPSASTGEDLSTTAHPEATNAPIEADPYCASDDVVLFDGANGTGNRICFSGTGNADLSQYTHSLSCSRTFCVRTTWAGKVASYRSNAYVGDLAGRYPSGLWDVTIDFDKNSGARNVPSGFSANKLASWLPLYPPPPAL